MTPAPPPEPTLSDALLATGGAIAVITAGLVGFGGAVPVPVLLMLACVPPAALALARGARWEDLEDGLVHGMSLALAPLSILIVVGATVGAWAASGTIATMVDLGIAVLSPSWFLPAALLVCSGVSLAIGSSWATAGTVGVALMGVGEALGIPAPWCAGAVISGAYFGDKMSPLSDTTNLAPGIAGVGLFDHIRAMLATTVPAYLLALVGFVALGATGQAAGTVDASSVTALRGQLAAAQVLSPWLLLPPVVLVALALRRVAAIPALVLATSLSLVQAWWVQGGDPATLLATLYGGHTQGSEVEAVERLLSRGGVASMHDTIALILTATAFGGLLEKAGYIATLLEATLRRVTSGAQLLQVTVLSAIGVNVLIAEQYLAIVLPGRMFRAAYERYGLHPTMLSRSLEDAGTVTSPLCPWNSCGAYMAGTLGVATAAYLPFAFFNLLMPVVALVYAQTGWFVRRADARPA